MCSRDYLEPVEPPLGRNDADHVLVCPEKRERERKASEAKVEVLRLKGENERLLTILENVSVVPKPPKKSNNRTLNQLHAERNT